MEEISSFLSHALVSWVAIRYKHAQTHTLPPSCPLNHARTGGDSVSVHLPLSIFTYYTPVVCNARQVVDL